MKLQTKLTLWFSVLLLLVYAALLTAMHMISGRAAEATARTTLESAVARYADEATGNTSTHGVYWFDPHEVGNDLTDTFIFDDELLSITIRPDEQDTVNDEDSDSGVVVTEDGDLLLPEVP